MIARHCSCDVRVFVAYVLRRVAFDNGHKEWLGADAVSATNGDRATLSGVHSPHYIRTRSTQPFQAQTPSNVTLKSRAFADPLAAADQVKDNAEIAAVLTSIRKVG